MQPVLKMYFYSPLNVIADFAAGFVYVGVVHRGKQKVRALMGILNAESVEVMLEDDTKIISTDVAEFSPEPLRRIVPFTK
eukprot:UN08595